MVVADADGDLSTQTIPTSYTLPIATGTVLGGIKVGSGLSITSAGVLSATATSADNLGDHTATQNIQLNSEWLSNDGDNEGIKIDNSGKVGIGISSTFTTLRNQLDIYNSTGQSLMLVRNDGSTTDTEQLGGIGFDSKDGNVPDDIKEASASIIAFAAESHGTSDKGGDLTFWTSPINQNDDTEGFERMRITSEGNIGINETNLILNWMLMVILELDGRVILLECMFHHMKFNIQVPLFEVWR